MSKAPLDPRLVEVHATLKKAIDLQRFNRMGLFKPYTKQLAFFAMSADERLLMAGNRQGKTEAGAFECAVHLTGKYPDWWPKSAHRVDHPCEAWAAGESSLAVRDILQTKLIGPVGLEAEYGTGYIPKEDLLDWTMARGVSDAMDTVHVQHYAPDGNGGWIKDGVSSLTFKSYEQGRQKWQGTGKDFVWFDEEPPEAIYSEGKTRTLAGSQGTRGFVYMTFTPLLGQSTVVLSFTSENQDPDASRDFITMTIDDALHLLPEDRKKIIAAYAPWEREARIMGVPLLGSGRIFITPESALMEPGIQPELIPAYWRKIWGTDFGIDHPFAAALLLWDVENDIIHVHHVFRQSDTLPIQHAFHMKRVAAAVPVAWPQDGTQRQTDGDTLAAHYRRHGLIMLGEHGTWPDGGNSTEAGVLELDERMQTGRFKVAEHLTEFFEEYRLYHRDKGKIVKLKDDILSAVRTGVMMKRYARPVPLGEKRIQRKGPNDGIADGLDFDVFGS